MEYIAFTVLAALILGLFEKSVSLFLAVLIGGGAAVFLLGGSKKPRG